MTGIGNNINIRSDNIFHARKHIKLNISPIEILAKHSFQAFAYMVFKTLDGGTTFLPNWHFFLLCEYMRAVAAGDINRMIINMPPRYMKSMLCSVALPAWLLKENPANKIIVASYSQELAITHHIATRAVIESDWYKRQFPHVQLSKDQNTKRKFNTTDGGHRIGVSVGGTLTGEGCDYLIIDDPLNPKQAYSEKERQRHLQWFEQTAYTRLNNKKKGVMLLIMHRLHMDDLAGYLIRKGGWEQLKIPAIEVEDKTYSFGGFSYTRKKDELLHPARESLDEIQAAMENMGSYAFAGQYQQEPAPKGGGVFKINWFPRFSVEPQNHERIVQTWDTGIKTEDSHDPSVCLTFKEVGNKSYLIHVFRGRVEYPELKRTVSNLAERFNADVILIEDKASGQALIQDLKRESRKAIIAIEPKGDKVVRANRHSAKVESGLVLLPEFAPWLPEFEMEIGAFPNSSNDDQVDALSQYLDYIHGNAATPTPRIRRL